jgi:hypothetical protein
LNYISEYLDQDALTQCNNLSPFIDYCFNRQAYRLYAREEKSEKILQKIVDKGIGKRDKFDFVFPNEKRECIIKTMKKYGVDAECQLEALLENHEYLKEFKDVDVGKWEYKELFNGFNGLKTKGLITSVYCNWC